MIEITSNPDPNFGSLRDVLTHDVHHEHTSHNTVVTFLTGIPVHIYITTHTNLQELAIDLVASSISPASPSTVTQSTSLNRLTKGSSTFDTVIFELMSLDSSNKVYEFILKPCNYKVKVFSIRPIFSNESSSPRIAVPAGLLPYDLVYIRYDPSSTEEHEIQHETQEWFEDLPSIPEANEDTPPQTRSSSIPPRLDTLSISPMNSLSVLKRRLAYNASPIRDELSDEELQIPSSSESEIDDQLDKIGELKAKFPEISTDLLEYIKVNFA
ncbi:hypothetical protein P9112_014005 [Eukaryota sp. TZLM1-RC]